LKNTLRNDLKRDENHLVSATIIVNDSEIIGVPCKIYLPERIYEKPYIILKPSKEDANKIMSSQKGKLYATVYGFDKNKELTIEAPEVYFSGGSTKHWGDGVSDSTVPGEPQDLNIIRHLKDSNNSQDSQIEFWISPNSFLTPAMMSTSSYTGDLKYERVRNVEFLIKNGIKLVFDKHFRSKKADNRDFVQWSFLVACAELKTPVDDVKTLKTNILQDVDDFLLIASFAARQRTACLGWTASDKKSYSTFYRGNYVFPQPDDDHDIDNGVIDFKDFERFIQVCYAAFLKYENKLALRNALFTAVPSQSRTLETSFLNLFAGLETLVLDYKRREDLEFVLQKDEWSPLKKYLKKCIKNSTVPKLETEQRASIYNKLEELNRISLSEAFDLFCKKYSIDLSDLWPVFRENGFVGLVDIRNKLIHGDPFSHDMFGALVVAKEHLLYIFERVLTRILHWDLAKTKINSVYLQSHMTAVKDMVSEQAKLSDYIFSSASPKNSAAD